METTLHRQLKGLYGIDDIEREVRVGKYRIDAVVNDLLIEVQVASLAAIRRKIADLIIQHRVLVVKPVVARSYIVRRSSLVGDILWSRYSPTVHKTCEVFDELVHFAKLFPHPNLSVEVLYIEQEEHRIPRKTWRGRREHRVTDRKLRSIIDRQPLNTTDDLLRFLPDTLPMEFSTADLANLAEIPRWLAQKMAYVLRHTGAVEVAGKKRNSVVYRQPKPHQRAA